MKFAILFAVALACATTACELTAPVAPHTRRQLNIPTFMVYCQHPQETCVPNPLVDAKGRLSSPKVLKSNRFTDPLKFSVPVSRLDLTMNNLARVSIAPRCVISLSNPLEIAPPPNSLPSFRSFLDPSHSRLPAACTPAHNPREA